MSVDERSCGTCSLCCKLLKIPPLDKPTGEWCAHCVPGKGCGIYDARPEACRSFRCGWLDRPELEDWWNPQRSGIILWLLPKLRQLVIDVEPSRPDAWRRQPYYDRIKLWARRPSSDYMYVIVYVGRRAFAVFPDQELDLGVLAEDEVPVLGYATRGAYRHPAAKILGRDPANALIVGRASPAGAPTRD